MVTSFVCVWFRALRTVSKQYNPGTVSSHRQKYIFFRIQLHELFSLTLGNLLMKNNTYSDRSSKMANHLRIQRAGTHFEPGDDTEYRDPSSSYIYGPTLNPDGTWRIKTNDELRHRMK